MEIIQQASIAYARKASFTLSPDGQYLIIYIKALKTLRFYKVEDGNICSIFEKMNLDDENFKSIMDEESLDGIKKMVFDKNVKHLICYSYEKVTIIKLEGEDSEPEVIYYFHIDESMFRLILDV